jgi:DNA-binding MarR family transcriptional regulator
MGEAGVTLPQVLLLNRVATLDRASISELAEQSPGTRAAVGQMVDRLVRQGLLHRLEDSDDRRRRSVSVSAAGAAFLRELEQARTAEYAIGLARIDPALRAELERLLQRVVAEIEHTPVGADQ